MIPSSRSWRTRPENKRSRGTRSLLCFHPHVQFAGGPATSQASLQRRHETSKNFLVKESVPSGSTRSACLSAAAAFISSDPHFSCCRSFSGGAGEGRNRNSRRSCRSLGTIAVHRPAGPSGVALLRKATVVRVKGLEPPRLAAPEPKSGASTNSATPATGQPLAKQTEGCERYSRASPSETARQKGNIEVSSH